MQDLFTKMYLLDEKIKQSVEESVKMDEKNGFHYPENQFHYLEWDWIISKIRFPLWLPVAERNFQIKEYFFKYTENCFLLAGIRLRIRFY